MSIMGYFFLKASMTFLIDSGSSEARPRTLPSALAFSSSSSWLAMVLKPAPAAGAAAAGAAAGAVAGLAASAGLAGAAVGGGGGARLQAISMESATTAGSASDFELMRPIPPLIDEMAIRPS